MFHCDTAAIEFPGPEREARTCCSHMKGAPAKGCRKLLFFSIVALLCAWLPLHGSTMKLSHSATRLTSTQENVDAGIFSDLSPTHDGGVANPTDGSTGNALQQTLIDAYFWGVAHGGARATVIAASDYPVSGSRILVPGNVDLVCSSYAPQTYTGGCSITQTDPGNNTASGGSPLLVADFSIGVLADHKTKCSIFDNPAQPGCTIISSSGGSISGFTLYGAGVMAGGADVGIRVAANNFSVQDTAITGFFGGPGIQNVNGVNNSYDWNYGTNVDIWWCQNASQVNSTNLNSSLLITDGNLGGMDLSMTDGEASNNQYSTGCAFSKGFSVSMEYPNLAAMHVNGAGNLIQDNLLQVDGIGLITNGEEERVIANRVEYHAREAVLNYAGNSLFSDNHMLSACLDPNLPNLRPGAPDNGIPGYPSASSSLHPGYLLMDANGNVEQDVYGNQAYGYGVTDTAIPDWGANQGDTVETAHIVWENSGPWQPGLTSRTDSGNVPAMTSGLCFGVKDLGQSNTWSDNQVGEELAVDGPSFYRGSYYIPYPGALTGNTCDQDQSDVNGNGQCWWGGDLFSNGGPPGLQPNGKMISAAGGGTAWVGDYSVLVLTDTTPKTYNNFQGMSSGQFFYVTSTNAADVIDSWSVGNNGGVYGHPSLLTCGGLPLTIEPNTYYEFYYNSSTPWGITQVNCPSQPASATLALAPSGLVFDAQTTGTTSSAKLATLTNTGTVPVAISIIVSGPFAQSNTCGTALAPAASCKVAVTFSPTAAGATSGTLTATNTLNGATYTISLSGTGEAPVVAAPVMTVSATSLVFGAQLDGTTSASKTVEITNSGSAPLSVSLAMTSAFTQTDTCSSAMAAGTTCSVSVTFSPVSVGNITGALNITSNAAGSPQTISLSGTGVAVSTGSGSGSSVKTIAISSSMPSITIAASGASVSAPLVISSVGGFSGNVTLSCSVVDQTTGTPADQPTCSLTPPQAYLTENAQSLSSVTVTMPSASASLAHRDGGFPRGYVLSGLIFAVLFPGLRKRRALFTMCLCVLAITGMTGCGVVKNTSSTSSSTGSNVSPGSYQVRVVATSGTLTGSVAIPVTVQ